MLVWEPEVLGLRRTRPTQENNIEIDLQEVRREKLFCSSAYCNYVLNSMKVVRIFTNSTTTIFKNCLVLPCL